MENNFQSFHRNSVQTCSMLPTPDPRALAISQKLHQHIIEQIDCQRGPLSLADYMDLALYSPNLGYYSGDMQIFGAAGDYITASELCPLFSHCLANTCFQVLEHLGEGNILEIGAGTGEMAVEILLWLAAKGTLPEHYYIYEISEGLRSRQSEKFRLRLNHYPELLSRIIWLDNPNQLKAFKGIIVANEVLDALPVHRFLIQNKKFFEMQISHEDGNLVWQNMDASRTKIDEKLHSSINEFLLNRIEGDGFCSEVNINLENWLAPFNECLKKGLFLLIDYGFPRSEYYHPDRHMGTLMCHYQQRCHTDPLLYPGLQDITAHVDFTNVAEAANQANMDILGFTTQANFLIHSGLLDCLEQLEKRANSIECLTQRQAINILTSPAEMGELFKVIGLGREFDLALPGFQADMRHRL